MRATWVRCWCLCTVVACGGDAPVLRGVPDQPLLQKSAPDAELPNRSDAEERASVDAPSVYEKSPEIYIDVHYLGGRPFSDVRHILADQLGEQISRAPLDDGGEEIRFSRGTVRLEDGLIYMMDVKLPQPMRRSDALQKTGYPQYVGRYAVLHREYRLNHEWGYRRIRMRRLDRESELVTAVEAWRWVPGEHTQRR